MTNKEHRVGITNTARQAQVDPLMTLVVTLGAGGIERQEAAGQRELANSQLLPTDGAHLLEAFGAVLGPEVPDDPMFREVTLPAGWTKRATDHAMHTDILDEQGRKRAGVFYKAAFYDRRAQLRLGCRFSMGMDYDRDKAVVYVVKDGDTVIHETEPVTVEHGSPDYYPAQDRAEASARAWLTERYPNWNDPTAYW